MRTVLSHQSLRQYAKERGGDHIRIDTQINQPRYRRGSIVGMQSGKDQVPSIGGLKGYFGGLSIADFPHHDHVWILAQNGA